MTLRRRISSDSTVLFCRNGQDRISLRSHIRMVNLVSVDEWRVGYSHEKKVLPAFISKFGKPAGSGCHLAMFPSSLYGFVSSWRQNNVPKSIQHSREVIVNLGLRLLASELTYPRYPYSRTCPSLCAGRVHSFLEDAWRAMQLEIPSWDDGTVARVGGGGGVPVSASERAVTSEARGGRHQSFSFPNVVPGHPFPRGGCKP